MHFIHASLAPQIISRKRPIHMYADERNKVQIADLHIIDGYISLYHGCNILTNQIDL